MRQRVAAEGEKGPKRAGRMGVKFCGGCNPQIDRCALTESLEKKLGFRLRTPLDHTGEKWLIGILICGCPTVCADRPEARNLARKWIVIGGSTIDSRAVSEKDLATLVAAKINDLLDGEKS